MEYRVNFWDNEVPQFGDGNRGIGVLKLGTKWVRLIEIGSGHTARISRKLWDTLPKHVVKRNKLTGEVVY